MKTKIKLGVGDKIFYSFFRAMGDIIYLKIID